MRETSSRSSTRRERCLTWRSMTWRSGAPTAPSRRAISSSEVTIGASGLRSSWPSIARNSSFTRPADCACASAARDSANRRTLSSASAARRAISPTRATSSASKRRPDSAWITAIAPIVRPRATSGMTQAARRPTTRTNSATPGSAIAAMAASSKWPTNVWPVAIAHGNVPGASAEATLRATQPVIARVRSGSRWCVTLRSSTPSPLSRSMRHRSAMSGTIEVAIVVSADPSSSEVESDELAATSSCSRRSACSAVVRASRSASSSDSRSRSLWARRAAAATSASEVASISAMPVSVSCTGSPRPSAPAASRRRAIACSMRREAKRAANAASTTERTMPPPNTSTERQNACSPTDRGMPRVTVQPADLMRASAVLTRSPSSVELWPNPSSRPFRVAISCDSDSPGDVPRSLS